MEVIEVTFQPIFAVIFDVFEFPDEIEHVGSFEIGLPFSYDYSIKLLVFATKVLKLKGEGFYVSPI